MKVGINSLVLGEGVLEESFARAAEAGAEGIEVEYTGTIGAKWVGQSDHAASLQAMAQKCRLAIPSLCLGFLRDEPALFGPEEMVERSRASISHAIALAAQVGAKVVQIPFFGRNTIDLEDELNRAIDALLPLVETAEEKGVVLGIESTLTIPRMRFLLDSLGGSEFVRITYNVGNSLARRIDPAIGLRHMALAGISQVHFMDVKLTEGAPPEVLPILGGGNVDFRGVVQALRAIGYDGWIIVSTPPAGDPVAAAKANLAFARAVFGE